MPWTASVRSQSAADISSGVRTAGAGAMEDPGSGRDGLGGGEDMIEPKLADTKLLWRC